MQKILIVLLMAVALAGAGCARKKAKPGPSSSSLTEAGADTSVATPDGAADGGNTGSDEETGGPQTGLLAKRVIYFDFDSSEIKREGNDVVAAHAKYLASHGGMRIRLEGNTDARGSREYNIRLGERRAQAVRRALLLQGAT